MITMEVTNDGVKLSALEKTIINQDAKALAIGMYQIDNNSLPKEMNESTVDELNTNYISASGYILEMYAQQPQMQDAIKLMENKLSHSGYDDLERILEEQNPAELKDLNSMCLRSMSEVFGESEKGAEAYINSHLKAKQSIFSNLEYELSNNEELKDSVDVERIGAVANLYTNLVISQAKEIFGELPAPYQQLLERSYAANDNNSSENKYDNAA